LLCMQPGDMCYEYSNAMHDFTYIVIPDNPSRKFMNFVTAL